MCFEDSSTISSIAFVDQLFTVKVNIWGRTCPQLHSHKLIAQYQLPAKASTNGGTNDILSLLMAIDLHVKFFPA